MQFTPLLVNRITVREKWHFLYIYDHNLFYVWHEREKSVRFIRCYFSFVLNILKKKIIRNEINFNEIL